MLWTIFFVLAAITGISLPPRARSAISGADVASGADTAVFNVVLFINLFRERRQFPDVG